MQNSDFMWVVNQSIWILEFIYHLLRPGPKTLMYLLCWIDLWQPFSKICHKNVWWSFVDFYRSCEKRVTCKGQGAVKNSSPPRLTFTPLYHAARYYHWDPHTVSLWCPCHLPFCLPQHLTYGNPSSRHRGEEPHIFWFRLCLGRKRSAYGIDRGRLFAIRFSTCH